MRVLIISLLLLTSCLNQTSENLVDKLSLVDIGQRLNGHWRLVSTKTDGQTKINANPDNLEYYEFEGIKGMNSEMTDNHDGTFAIPTCQPSCRLKEENKKKKIQYIGLAGSWELEIVKISKDELVLTNSSTSWTYERKLIRYW
jgi:hypothetical protein